MFWCLGSRCVHSLMNGFQPLLMVKYLTLIKAQGCKTAGCNIKAASIRLTYKNGTPPAHGQGEWDQCGCEWRRRVGGERVELCKRSFVRRLSSLARRKIKVEERNLHSLNRCCPKNTLSPTCVAGRSARRRLSAQRVSSNLSLIREAL